MSDGGGGEGAGLALISFTFMLARRCRAFPWIFVAAACCSRASDPSRMDSAVFASFSVQNVAPSATVQK
jgi:hypothetical protein